MTTAAHTHALRLSRAQVGYHEINLTTTGMNYPMLAGNLASILISTFVCVIVSLIKPDNYDWESTRNLKMVEEEWTGVRLLALALPRHGHTTSSFNFFEATCPACCTLRCCAACLPAFNYAAALSADAQGTRCAGITEDGKDSAEAMDNAYKWICIWGTALALLLFVLWPLLALPARVFSKGYFTFWSVAVPAADFANDLQAASTSQCTSLHLVAGLLHSPRFL